MKARTFLRVSGIGAMGGLGLMVLAIAGAAGWYLMGLAPVKVSVVGRVVDGTGGGIRNACVEATALPISSPESESAMEPPGTRFQRTFGDAGGYFQMKHVSIGVDAAEDKGGYVQEYTLIVSAEGYRPLPMHLRYEPGHKEKGIVLGDIVLERLPSLSGSPAAVP